MAGPRSRSNVLMILVVVALIGFLGGGLIGSLRDRVGNTPDGSGSTASPDGGTPTATGTAQLTLQADNTAVAPDTPIKLSGQLTPAQAGVTVQVERRLDGGAWGDFPVATQTGADGSFSTQIRSGRAGTNEFRVSAEVSGTRVESDPVTVQIG